MDRLTDRSTIKELMEKYGFTFSKGLGQNFLINPSVCPRMAEMCGAAQAAGAAALLGIFKVCFVRWERMERNKRRRAKRAAQNKPRGFCGDIRRDNSWMQETTRL